MTENREMNKTGSIGDGSDTADWDSADEFDQDQDARLRGDVEGFEGPLDLLLAMARTQ